MGKKILIVEDDPVNSKLIQANLDKEGYETVTAMDGDVGLQKVQEERPDLIILDVEMPRMNGYTFITQLNKMVEKKIPVIVLTAHSDMQPIFQLNGVRTYLVKPVDFEKLYESIVKCLNED
ncbi:MAG: response regulator [Candidatus Omnitrophica bacterium]|nr:response regulator [Candidatus Omnitrophota bacterium]